MAWGSHPAKVSGGFQLLNQQSSINNYNVPVPESKPFRLTESVKAAG
jgi:hypothetical protein